MFLSITVKDYLRHLFHGFRSEYFNKSSLTISYSFIINCARYENMHGFEINLQRKIMFRVKCKNLFPHGQEEISILTTCVM